MDITALDTTMLITAMLTLPSMIWPMILAMAVSAARLALTAVPRNADYGGLTSVPGVAPGCLDDG